MAYLARGLNLRISFHLGLFAFSLLISHRIQHKGTHFPPSSPILSLITSINRRVAHKLQLKNRLNGRELSSLMSMLCSWGNGTCRLQTRTHKIPFIHTMLLPQASGDGLQMVMKYKSTVTEVITRADII